MNTLACVAGEILQLFYLLLSLYIHIFAIVFV